MQEGITESSPAAAQTPTAAHSHKRFGRLLRGKIGYEALCKHASWLWERCGGGAELGLVLEKQHCQECDKYDGSHGET